MLKGLWKLTWVETKVFVREPLGLVGSLIIPVVIYVLMARAVGPVPSQAPEAESPFNVAILAALIIAVGAVLSLIAIIAIYREGGILKRLRATPLSPVTILAAHVVVKLGFTVASLALLVVAGRRFFPGALDVDLLSFGAALLLSTLSILALGFVLASLVPTARFAQPLGAAILYPMVAISGLFVPVDRLPGVVRAVARVLPTTHAVSLMQGVWDGVPWLALWVHVAALLAAFALCVAVSARVFRWE
ncbi:MAG: ABC transporter permease [Gemmatimonadales bacterium]|nr:ABC transporter permease [Gemmatimonadota bacterium]MCL4212936.1 ABC transporter permease [Gemmatimonadales bacterium]